ncbi:MAG: hypothetical protein JJLCMIEE_01180 [Acidimicrobiales bacterium]|nr:hypothetical protein [Acidimicrobiales bacterium]
MELTKGLDRGKEFVGDVDSYFIPQAHHCPHDVK